MSTEVEDDEAAESGETLVPHRTYRVATGPIGASAHNTIVVRGMSLTLPLELDLDDDPLQDDEVRLRSQDGFFEQHVRASDPEAEPLIEERLLLYHFRDVPPGVYNAEVNAGGRWRTVVRGLLVERSGADGADPHISGTRESPKLGGEDAHHVHDDPEGEDRDVRTQEEDY